MGGLDACSLKVGGAFERIFERQKRQFFFHECSHYSILHRKTRNFSNLLKLGRRYLAATPNN